MAGYKLSASLHGHEDDVRAVAFPNAALVLSASRDATVRCWRLLSPKPPLYECTLLSHGSAFVNSITYVPPSSSYPEGLVISGGKDTIIEVRQPGKSPEDPADALLLGHTANVCALDASHDGRLVVSGGWDAEARVWHVDKWEAPATVLQGHELSVWAVLAYDAETIITGCADKLIRVFNPSGELLQTIRGSADVVRALCRLNPKHPSAAEFASAGNDAIIRLWTLQGKQIAQLQGHESFIYAIACLPNGQMVSCSEDRSVRIWAGSLCAQTITHPAISVWSVAVCHENGDIVTGSSDRVVRVFSNEPSRQASPEDLRAFDDSVKSSSIPKQTIADVHTQQHPGPEFLQQKSGTREGQIQIVREQDGTLSAHQWSQTVRQWLNVGTVVDSAGSNGRKREFQGRDYDYVFDVDIEEGKPPLQLPFNLWQNPYEAARKFIADHELPLAYLDQVANFIITNTEGATLDSSSRTLAPGSDPWGQESRYRPGELGSVPPPSELDEAAKPKVLPQTQYLCIRTANLQTIQKKISESSQQLIDDGSKDISLNPSELSVLAALCKQLDSASGRGLAAPMLNGELQLVLKLISVWPPDRRLPGLDLLRLLTPSAEAAAYTSSSNGKTIVDVIADTGVFGDVDRPNSVMLAVRALANLFETEAGRFIADGEFEKIHELVKPLASSRTNNRNLMIALCTLYINFAVLFTSTSAASNMNKALALLDDLCSILGTEKDSEALYRALVAAGTLLSMGEEVRVAAKETCKVEERIKEVASRVKEPRTKGVIAEIRDVLA